MTAAQRCEIEVTLRIAGRGEEIGTSVFFLLYRPIDLVALTSRMGQAVQTAAQAELRNGVGSSPLIAGVALGRRHSETGMEG